MLAELKIEDVVAPDGVARLDSVATAELRTDVADGLVVLLTAALEELDDGMIGPVELDKAPLELVSPGTLLSEILSEPVMLPVGVWVPIVEIEIASEL